MPKQKNKHINGKEVIPADSSQANPNSKINFLIPFLSLVVAVLSICSSFIITKVNFKNQKEILIIERESKKIDEYYLLLYSEANLCYLKVTNKLYDGITDDALEILKAYKALQPLIPEKYKSDYKDFYMDIADYIMQIIAISGFTTDPSVDLAKLKITKEIMDDFEKSGKYVISIIKEDIYSYFYEKE
jgi:hypothetical protein